MAKFGLTNLANAVDATGAKRTYLLWASKIDHVVGLDDDEIAKRVLGPMVEGLSLDCWRGLLDGDPDKVAIGVAAMDAIVLLEACYR